MHLVSEIKLDTSELTKLLHTMNVFS